MTSDATVEFWRALDALIDHAVAHLDLDPRDIDWTRNRALTLFRCPSWEPGESTPRATDAAAPHAGAAPAASPSALIGRLARAALDAGLCSEDELATLVDELMGILTPAPSAVQDAFLATERERGAMAALDDFHARCVANAYVKKDALDANPRFEAHGLVITINCAKPEFRSAAAAAAGQSFTYPLCTICHENEGWAGRQRSTLRTIPVRLGGEEWFWQYSPYGYFHHHGICVNREHTPMKVDAGTFVRLMDFVDRFPGYFIGSNAALPRIGGSVLAHDHYQGGGEVLPIHHATPAATLVDATGEVPADTAVVEILDWPGTALRIVSRSREAVVTLADRLRRAWEDHEDPALGIAPRAEDGSRQSAVSPTVRVSERGYELSLVLRNNAVSEEHPLGVFHAHPEYHAVKQESIGLIETQGLFVLPGRLVDELARIEDALVTGGDLPDELGAFTLLWDELRDTLGQERDRDTVRAAIREEVGSVCWRILGNTAVFPTLESVSAFVEAAGFARP